jgi:hypothetical protein
MRALITIALLFSSISGDVSAAYFRDGGFLANKGILESIRIEPRLPAFGERNRPHGGLLPTIV